MKTIRVYQLNHLTPMLFHRLKEAQMEAAHVWNCCMEMHQQARLQHTRWPGRNDLQQVTKGHFALHSQSVFAARFCNVGEKAYQNGYGIVGTTQWCPHLASKFRRTPGGRLRDTHSMAYLSAHFFAAFLV